MEPWVICIPNKTYSALRDGSSDSDEVRECRGRTEDVLVWEQRVNINKHYLFHRREMREIIHS